MERIIRIQVERLPEGLYLATSDDIQGLVAQGRTIAEALEIARDIAKKLLEEQGIAESPDDAAFERLEFPVVVGL
jgi:predicted RNase H-like HicB family nuclease